MTNYVALHVVNTPSSDVASDLAAALLADIGYESFEPSPEGLTAYIRSDIFSEEAAHEALAQFPMPEVTLTLSHEFIEGQDWNSEWERHYFQPIVIGSKCVVHSSFHTDVPQAEYDIVIDPKMAFGTGHHATTSQVVEAILQQDLNGKTVIDMGAGTGILGILCAMRGAQKVRGVEIDPDAQVNAVENLRLNHVESVVDVLLGDASTLAQLPEADLFIANINRNIITADIAAYVTRLKPGGTMLLSGFYEHDIPVIMAAAAPLGLSEVTHTVLNEWTCLQLTLNK